jgi:sensor histidine kinase regulating citrate/malate metabolism
LDNAIEACRKLPGDHERVIDIQAKFKNARLTIRIANSSAPVQIVNNLSTSTKKDKLLHGFGLINIQKTVHDNGGNAVIQYEDGMFILSIIFLL